MEEDMKVPIDKQLVEFRNHILANPRTFLASKFGDGKSYFLEQFKKENKNDFVFITLYPVNYQVASNEDIFNLIKRDILFQLMVQGLFEAPIEISDELVLWGFIQNHYKSFLIDLIPYMASVVLPAEWIPKVSSVLNHTDVFINLKQKFDEYKSKFNEIEQLLEQFLNKVDSSFVYEEDFITSLIKQTLQKNREIWKEKGHEKLVVLIVEDLDRLDPAHLFRILNIFSAHIDYSYKLMNKPNGMMVGNKFGFDNVIFVADFANVRKIFKHFYGEQTDFKGYIGKFLSSAPYEYSIREVRKDYIYNHLEKVLHCPRSLIETLLPNEILETKTIRECVQSFGISSQVVQMPPYLSNEGEVKLDITILKILSVMRRLKIADDDIVQNCSSLIYSDKKAFCKYVAPYMLLFEKQMGNLDVEIYKNEENSRVEQLKVRIDAETGMGGEPDVYLCSDKPNVTDFASLFRFMLGYVVK